MELKEKTLELKDKAVMALEEWANGRIGQFIADNPMAAPAGKYLKRGVSNIIARYDGKIGEYIDTLMLFVADKDGNFDAGMLFDDALSMFSSMPETPFTVAGLHGTVGAGTVRIVLPDNPLVSLFLGNMGAVRITADDFRELKEILMGDGQRR